MTVALPIGPNGRWPAGHELASQPWASVRDWASCQRIRTDAAIDHDGGKDLLLEHRSSLGIERAGVFRRHVPELALDDLERRPRR